MERRANDLPPRVADALAELRRRAVGLFGARLLDVRLYGSYARGDFHAQSDVDVLVVVAGLSRRERRAIFDVAFDVFAESLVRISPLALSDDEFRTLRDREYLIVREIERDGIPV